jgi:CDP-diacylglycerol--serine O-phosphatidyltransferase
MLIIGLLMASRLPTLSIKKMSVPRAYAPVVLLLFALFVASLVIEPWKTLAIVGAFYLTTLCITPFMAWRMMR